MGASIILDSKVIQRFWKKVDRSQLGPGGCWVWVAAKNKKGYGIGRFLCVAGEKRTTYAHRFSYLLHYGELPPGKIGDKNLICVCHKCDNRACVNPTHLFLGTDKDNAADRDKKGRLVTPDNSGESNGMSILTPASVMEIRRLYLTGSYTQRGIGKMFGVSNIAVSDIVRGARWKWLK